MGRYDNLAQKLREAIELADGAGLKPNLMKGRVGEILLANHLDHVLPPVNAGHDATSADGKNTYEYKVGTSGKYVFNYGSRMNRLGQEVDYAARLRAKHGDSNHFVYVAQLGVDGKFVEIAHCAGPALAEYLIEWFRDTSNCQILERTFNSIDTFLRIDGSERDL